MGLTIVALLIVAAAGSWLARAAQQSSDIGYIDASVVEERYIVPLIKSPLEKEQQKLQQEFDAKSKGLSDKEKQDLFDTYQSKLETKQNELYQGALPKVNTAIAQVAQAAGVRLVIDASVVHYGGTNLTTQVLTKLGIKN